MRNFKRDKELVTRIYFAWSILSILYLFLSLNLNVFKLLGN